MSRALAQRSSSVANASRSGQRSASSSLAGESAAPSDWRSPTRKTYNVLMIAPTSFFADYGCHVRILEEARILQQLGNRVTICTYHNGRDVEGLDVYRTLPIPWRADYEVGSSRHKIGFDALLLLKTLTVAMRVRPDVVHGHLHEGALIGNAVSKVFGVPLVFDFQGSMTGEMIDHHFLNPTGPFFRPARWLEQKIVQMPTGIVTSSSHAKGLLTNDFHCLPDRIKAIPDSVNADFFAPGQPARKSRALKASLGVPPDRQVVVYLGLLAEWQGTDLLLRAAAQLVPRRPDVHFLVMGFPGVEVYRQKARSLGLSGHVTFTGKIPYHEAPDYLALGDVAVAPKISATEGSGKLLNYMAMGLPIVAFDVPVSREYLNELGVYARPRDVSSLADALESLLFDSERAATLAALLRQRAIERYSWRAAGEMIMDMYDQVSKW